MSFASLIATRLRLCARRIGVAVVLLAAVASALGCRHKTPYEEYLEQQAALLREAEKQQKAGMAQAQPIQTPPPAPQMPPQFAPTPTAAPVAAESDPVELQAYAVKNRLQILLTNKTPGYLNVSAYSFGVLDGRNLTKFNPTFVTNEFPVSSLPPDGKSVGYLTFRELKDLVGSKLIFYDPDHKPVAVTIQPMPQDSPAFPVVIPPPGESKLK